MKNSLTENIPKLEKLAREIRGRVVEMSHATGSPHLGGSLSCIDILVAVYWSFLRVDPTRPTDPDRDRFIISKGHAAAAIYATLSRRGFFSEEILQTFATEGSKLAEHPGPGCVPGIEAATGSLGHGLSLIVGMALAARLQGRSYRVCVLLSDGECQEGSVWEAAMFAPAKKLGTLVAIIDYNKWQATGRIEEVMAMNPLKSKWQSFNWNVCEVDGHDMTALVEALQATKETTDRPSAIVAHTVKGKGVSFMEDDNNWHYRIPTSDEVLAAKRELDLI